MKNKAVSIIVKVLLALITPLAVCLIYCLVRGVSLSDLYLPSSYNNDCVFYYKLVDAIVSKGGPTGYFGFNESHALYGGFAAWSPLIVLPWVLWGVAFGWSYSSVFVCNIVIFSLAFAAFVYLSDIDFKELGVLAVLLLLFPSFSIHLLNVLPEIILASVALIYMGFAARTAIREIKISYIVAMFITAAYLAMVRPYMILLMILPAYYLGKKIKKIWAFVTFVAVAAVSVAANFIIGHFFTSAYFDPLFKTDIITTILKGRFSEGFWMAVYMFRSMLQGIGTAVKDAFAYGLTMGIGYVVALVTALLVLVFSFKKGEHKLRPVYLSFFVTVATVLVAIVFLLQKTNEGGRHIWIFAFLGIIICCLSGFKVQGIVMKAVVLVLLVFFAIRGSMVPTDYDIPIAQDGAKENVEYWSGVFGDGKNVAQEAQGYDNTVIWVFVDYTADSSVVTEYNELYALPAGTGISCCYPDYVMNNFESLQSRYIITDSRGNVAGLCKDKGLEVIAEHGNVVMFRRAN